MPKATLEACLKDADISAQLSKLTEFGIQRLADMEGLTAEDYEAMDIPAQIASELPELYKEWSSPSYTPGKPMKRAGSKVKQIQEELQLDQLLRTQAWLGTLRSADGRDQRRHEHADPGGVVPLQPQRAHGAAARRPTQDIVHVHGHGHVHVLYCM